MRDADDAQTNCQFPDVALCIMPAFRWADSDGAAAGGHFFERAPLLRLSADYSRTALIRC